MTPVDGAAGAFTTLLAWIYYSAQILLLGAEFTHVYAIHYRTETEFQDDHRRVDDCQGRPA